jgi:hypothetical protein
MWVLHILEVSWMLRASNKVTNDHIVFEQASHSTNKPRCGYSGHLIHVVNPN